MEGGGLECFVPPGVLDKRLPVIREIRRRTVGEFGIRSEQDL